MRKLRHLPIIPWPRTDVLPRGPSGRSVIRPGPIRTEVGMTGKKEGLDKLKTELGKIPRDKKLVIYCGCCPFEHCPNVRPAISVLKEMKFTNYFLLDLPHNLKTDWIDKHYPVSNR